MSDSPRILFTYLALKYAAYSFWMYYGVTLFSERASAFRAAWLGFLRLIMGVVFGLGIYLVSTAVAGAAHDAGLPPQIVAYLCVYVPVRWLEWAIIGLALRPTHSPSALLLDTDWTGRKWRLGGIVISCLADLALFSDLGGLPIGRFFC